jgi:hypothetical protein
VQTQFEKRLILVSAIDAHEVIPPKADDEEYEDLGASKGPVVTQKMLDQEERKDIIELERQAMGLCRKVEISNKAEFMQQPSPFWLA